MENLQTFSNSEFGEINVLIVGGKEYFPATDCAKILGYSNPHEAIRTHCKGVSEFRTPSTGGSQNKKYITEGNLYRLIIKSKLPKAEKFESWVMDEVLPQIRQTGGYIPIYEKDSDLDILSRALLIADASSKAKDILITEMQPKADAYDTFLKTQGYISLNKAAKSLAIGRNTMMSLLRQNKVLFKDGRDNIPYQRFIKSGYFAVNHIVSRDGEVHSTTRVSSRGIQYIHKILANKSMEAVS